MGAIFSTRTTLEVKQKYRVLFEKYPRLWRSEETFAPTEDTSKIAKWPSWRW